MIRHYVEYFLLGMNSGEDSVQEVRRRTISEVELFEPACGFRFFDITEVEFRGEILKGEKKNISGWYYDGQEMDINDAIQSCGDPVLRAELCQLKLAGYARVCKVESKGVGKNKEDFNPYIPMEEKDTTI